MRIAGSKLGIKPDMINVATDYLASEDTSNWPSINDPSPNVEQIAALPAGLAVGAAKAVGALSALHKANLMLNGGPLADGTLDAFNNKDKPRRAQDYPVLNQF